MPSARRTVHVARPVAEVFAFFTTPANDPTWRPLVKEISSAGPVGVGSRIHQVVAGPGGTSIPADIEVTAYEPTTRYAFQVVAGPVRPHGEFGFEPNGEGTDVTLVLSADLGGLKKVFMAGAVQRSMDGEVAGLDRAKAALESV